MLVIIFHLLKSVAKISFRYVTNQCEYGTSLIWHGESPRADLYGPNPKPFGCYTILRSEPCSVDLPCMA